MGQVPLLLPTLIVLTVVAIEWRQSRLVAWAALGASFVLLVAALKHPSFSAEEIVAYGEELFAVPLAAARAIGAACFLYSVVRLLRSSPIPW